MKNQRTWRGSIPAALLLLAGSAAYGASVTPTTVSDWKAGNAAFECAAVGTYDYSCKIPESGDFPGAGSYACSFDDGHSNTITLDNVGPGTFDFSATNSIGAVIAKGGPAANVYQYDPQVYSDTGLSTPINPNNNKRYGISHLTFCWNPDPDKCYKGETAWSAGDRYQTPGNWATYTAYDGTEKTVTLFAGQTIVAGTVTFGAASDGFLDITITLQGAKFDAVNENIKIQGYSVAPSGNPNPGGFAIKRTATGTSYTVEDVPQALFYGVHVDLLVEIDCPADEE